MVGHTDSIKETKVCSKCGIEKDRSKFSRDRRSKDGFRSECKQCAKEYREGNKDKIIKILEKHFRSNLITTIITAIIVGAILTGAGIVFTYRISDHSINQINIELENATQKTTKEIQEDLYPNKFKVRTDIQSVESEEDQWSFKTSFINPTPYKVGRICIPFHTLIAKSKKLLVRITIENQSKYPANMVPITIYIDEGDFKEDIKSIKNLFVLENPYVTVYDPSPITNKEGKPELKGFRFLIEQIQGGEDFNFGFLPLTLEKETGCFVVVVRNNIYGFKINQQAQRLKMHDDKN